MRSLGRTLVDYLRRLKGAAEITAGLSAMYFIYSIQIIVFSLLYPLIEGRKEILALLPVMNDLRGDIFGSTGARMNTSLNIGEVRASSSSLVRLEAKPVSALTLLMSTTIIIVTFSYSLTLGERFNFGVMMLIGLIATLIATVILLPYTAFIVSEFFRRGWDPGNVMPSLVTGAGDLITLPTLVLAFFIVAHGIPSPAYPILALLLVSLSISIFIASILSGGSRTKRILKERTLVLAAIIVLQPIAGISMATFEEELAGRGLIHLVVAFIGVNGALASVAGVRLSVFLHLYGYRGVRGALTSISFDVLASAIPASLLVALVGYAFLPPGASFEVGLPGFLVTVMLATMAAVVLGLTISFSIALGAFKLNLDPDNVAIPLITTVMDVLGILVLYVASSIIAAI
ncbi:MAG: magnesium transporter [Thermoprotei archaeon]|nr:magnesium transporter [Thermoprotei archaeon]